MGTVQKTGKLGQRLGWHSRSCRPVLKQGCQVNIIFSPEKPKQSLPSLPGTSSSTPSSIGTDSVQTTPAHSSTALPLQSPNICIWNQAGRHHYGFRLLCPTEENVCPWGAEKNRMNNGIKPQRSSFESLEPSSPGDRELHGEPTIICCSLGSHIFTGKGY